MERKRLLLNTSGTVTKAQNRVKMLLIFTATAASIIFAFHFQCKKGSDANSKISMILNFLHNEQAVRRYGSKLTASTRPQLADSKKTVLSKTLNCSVYSFHIFSLTVVLVTPRSDVASR